MNNLDTIIERYLNGQITREESEDLVCEEARITACELVGPNSVEFESVWERLEDDYGTYVAEALDG